MKPKPSTPHLVTLDEFKAAAVKLLGEQAYQNLRLAHMNNPEIAGLIARLHFIDDLASKDPQSLKTIRKVLINVSVFGTTGF